MHTAMTPEDARLYTATRNAPEWVLRSVNASRRRQGAPEFRGGQFAVLDRSRRIRSAELGTLVGLATYGASIPTECDWDRRKLVERFAPTAFRDSVEEIKRGLRSAWLAFGHNADQLASTDEGTLGLFVHPIAGLQFWATLGTTDEHRKVCTLAREGKLGVSVGFVPEQFESRPAGNGERYRMITRAKLQHIALLDLNATVPAYRSAKVEHIWERDPEAISKALYVARLSSRLSALELKARRF